MTGSRFSSGFLYLGPMFFRYERPQAGRFRQFWQIGAEAIGSDDPAVDAETDRAAARAAGRARARAALRLRLGSLGSLDARAEYRERPGRLPARARRPPLGAEVRERIDLNPLRAFDAKDPGTQTVMARRPAAARLR